jgi:phospho-N-acetylmuramoyl-pentapeptide-transferase
MTELLTTFDALRIFMPAFFAFIFGIGLTPLLTHFLYKYKFWKPKAGKVALDGTPASTFNTLHEKREVGTPRAGGILVWASVLMTALVFSLLEYFFHDSFGDLAFTSREQTWLPLAALAAGAIVGFVDDLYEVRGRQGLRLRWRLLVVIAVSSLCAWWFYDKLDVSFISFPYLSSPLELGYLFIPFFVLVALSLYAGSIIDGIDGLSGGVYASIFTAYAGIAFFQNQFDIAGFCAAMIGGLLAFLWYNIPPARFYLSETGTMGITLALTVVVFLTDVRGEGKGLIVLPIIAFPLVVTVVSVVLQITGKKLLKRKILRIAPLHHHFEAIGWPPHKVVMRYWVVAIICAIVGMSVALV